MLRAIAKRCLMLLSGKPEGSLRRLVGRPQTPNGPGPFTIPAYTFAGANPTFLEGGTSVVILQSSGDRYANVRVMHETGVFWVNEYYITEGTDYEDEQDY